MQGDWVARIRVAGGHVRQGVVIRQPGLFGRRISQFRRKITTLFRHVQIFLPLFFNFKRFLCLLV